MSNHNRRLGQLGESVAKHILQAHGYVIYAENLHTPFGEIDLLCRKDNVLIAVEVKTRTSSGFCHAHRALHHKKIQRLLRCLGYIWPRYEACVALRVDGLLLGISAEGKLTDCELWVGL